MKVLSILSMLALAGAAAAASHPVAHPRKHHINRAATGQSKAARCAAVKKAADLAAQSSASVQSTQSVESTHSVHSVEATHTTHHDPAPTQDDNSDSGSSDSGNGGGGDRFGGDLTFYEMGADACGGNDGPNDMVAALAYKAFMSYGSPDNPNNSPICGRKALVHWGGKSCVVKIVDKCMGCVEESLDLSPRAFQIFSDLGAGRLHGMTWDWA